MLKAEELRIGNLVFPNASCWQFGEHVYVSAIGDGINNPHGYEEQGVYYQYQLNDVCPIPLTEEWLVKLGFLPSTAGFHLSSDRYRFSYYTDSDVFELSYIPYDGSVWQYIPLPKVFYVHQLQNLYFALTGQELTLTASPDGLVTSA